MGDDVIRTKIIGFEIVGKGYGRRKVPIVKRIGDFVVTDPEALDRLSPDLETKP